MPEQWGRYGIGCCRDCEGEDECPPFCVRATHPCDGLPIAGKPYEVKLYPSGTVIATGTTDENGEFCVDVDAYVGQQADVTISDLEVLPGFCYGFFGDSYSVRYTLECGRLRFWSFPMAYDGLGRSKCLCCAACGRVAIPRTLCLWDTCACIRDFGVGWHYACGHAYIFWNRDFQCTGPPEESPRMLVFDDLPTGNDCGGGLYHWQAGGLRCPPPILPLEQTCFTRYSMQCTGDTFKMCKCPSVAGLSERCDPFPNTCQEVEASSFTCNPFTAIFEFPAMEWTCEIGWPPCVEEYTVVMPASTVTVAECPDCDPMFFMPGPRGSSVPRDRSAMPSGRQRPRKVPTRSHAASGSPSGQADAKAGRVYAPQGGIWLPERARTEATARKAKGVPALV